MAEILATISVISFILAGAFAMLAIALWLLFQIPTVVGDLSGRNAKKTIERMRRDNEKNANKSYKFGTKSEDEGELPGAVKTSGKDELGKSYETELLVDEKETELLEEKGITMPLDTGKGVIKRKASTVKIALKNEIIYIHTEEVI